MGFFDRMKHALGFDGYGDDDIEMEGIDATVTPLRSRRQADEEDGDVLPAPQASENVTPAAATVPASMPADTVQVGECPDASAIFERVVEVFNESLPGFLQKSVDPERERRELFSALDSSMKDYFERLEKMVERRIQIRYQAESHRLQEQIDELRQKAMREEEVNTNAKNMQLSAERQKRALSERVHELEKQLASVEAENEQYILENKSMANKLRLASMTDREIDEKAAAAGTLLAENEARLSETESRLSEAQSRLADTEAKVAAAQESLSQANEELAGVRQQTRQEQEAILASQTEETASLKEEIARLTAAVEQAQAKEELSRAMVSEMTAKLTEATNSAAGKEEQVLSLGKELTAANEQLAQVNARLAKARNDLMIVKEVQEQVAQLEEKQRSTDAQLRRHKDELLEKDELLKAKDSDLLNKNTTLRIKDETIRRLEDQTDSLRKAIETAQYEKTQVESALMSEIERLKSIKGMTTQDIPAVAPVVAETPSITVEIADQAAATSPEIDLTIDLPDLDGDKKENSTEETKPKPRRGRPPKPRQEPAAQDVPPALPDMPDNGGLADSGHDDDGDFSLLDSTDWLIASPQPRPASKPKKSRKQKTADQSEDAFGYKEPVRQEPPDNPAQMLLW